MVVRAFVFSVRLMSSIWKSTDNDQRPSRGSEILDISAKLQFARVQLDEYASLLKEVYASVAGDPKVALASGYA